MKISTTIFRQISFIIFLFFAFSLSVFGEEKTYIYIPSDHLGSETITLTTEEYKMNDDLSFIANKGSSSKNVGYNKDGDLRLYYYQTGDGCSITLNPKNGVTITKVVLNAKENYTPQVKYNIDGGVDKTAYWSSSKMTISNISAKTSFKFRNANTVENKQLRLLSIEITYVTASVNSDYAVTLYDGDNQYGDSFIGSSIKLPSGPQLSDECQLAGWEFAGWSETKLEENAADVILFEAGSTYIPSKDIDLYAVYKMAGESMSIAAKTIPSGWEVDETSKSEKYWGMFLNNYIITPEISLDNISSIDVEMGTFGGSSANELQIVNNETSDTIATKIASSNSEDVAYTISSFSNNIGSGKLKFTSNATSSSVGLRIKSITIKFKMLYNSNPHCVPVEKEEYMIKFGDEDTILTVDGKIENIPNTLTISCSDTYTTFVGWTADKTFGVATKEPTLIDENTIFTEDTQLYPVYSKDIEGGEEAGELVTNVSNLSVGNEIFIVAKDYDFALSTTQNNNNRGHIAITKKGNNTIPIKTGIQMLTLKAGAVDGTFAFYTGSGYLYAASSSKNYLRTQAANNANGSWKIEIADDGTASVVAQGSNTRKVMQYNYSSSLFACYESASQQAIVLYKKTAVTSTEYYICGYETVESGDVYEVEDDFALNTVTLKSNYDQAAQINVTAGSLTAQKVIVEKTIDASRYYFFSLPFNCKIVDIVATDASANSLTYYDNYTIFYYDQKKASDNEGAKGKKAWVEITDTNTTLKANQGYIIGYLVDEGEAKATIKFKSSTSQTISTPATTTLNIDDYTWYTDGGVPTANGWNLIGMPYYQKPNNGSLSADINVYYATMPNDDGKTYTQTTFANADIAPFTSFFVQTEVAPTFTISAQQNAAPKLIDGRANYASQQKAVISFADANGAKDQTTIINNPNTTADYEIGHDLAKWIGYAVRPQIYSIQGDDILAFNSLAIDNSTVIPLGVYAHADGEYTFSLDAKSVGDLQGWELYDNEEGKTIRLANETLTVYLEKGKHEGRFELRLQQRVATDCDSAMSNMQTWVENGKLNIDNIPVDARVYIYDAVGRMLYADNEVSASFSYDLPVRGVYSIVVSSAVETIAFKTIY